MNLFLFLLVGIFGGTTGSLIKYVGQEVPPILLTVVRFGAAILLLLPLIVLKKEGIPKREQLKLLALAGILLGSNVVLFSIGIQHTSAIMGQIIYTPTSIIVAIFGYLFLGEKLSKNQVIGLAITIFGMFLLIGGSIGKSDIHTLGEPLGNILIVVGLFCWSSYLLVSRKALKNVSALTSTFYSFCIASIFALTFIPTEIQAIQKGFEITPNVIFAWATMILTSTVFIFLYQRFLKTTSAFVASLVTYINPISAAVFGITVFKERLTAQLLLGSAIVLFGVFISTSYGYVQSKITNK